MAQGSERVCVKYCVAYWSLTLNLKDTDLREREREREKVAWVVQRNFMSKF